MPTSYVGGYRVPQTVAMSISGHKTESMFRRYNITSTTDMLEALNRRRRYVETQASSSNVAAFPEGRSD